VPNILLEVISPERVVFTGQVKSVVLPCSEGDMTVLYGHEPVVTTMNPGLIVVTDSEGLGHTAFIAGGFVEITAYKVGILANRALPIADLTPEHLEEEILHHETIRDATRDPKRRQDAEFMIARLKQVRSALAF
jgi:F-type H+-transporting ATPase subunit epsilon